MYLLTIRDDNNNDEQKTLHLFLDSPSVDERLALFFDTRLEDPEVIMGMTDNGVSLKVFYNLDIHEQIDLIISYADGYSYEVELLPVFSDSRIEIDEHLNTPRGVP